MHHSSDRGEVEEDAGKPAGSEPKRERGWPPLRRLFAQDLMDQPLKVRSGPGGWKTVQTMLGYYSPPVRPFRTICCPPWRNGVQ